MDNRNSTDSGSDTNSDQQCKKDFETIRDRASNSILRDRKDNNTIKMPARLSRTPDKRI